VTITTIYYFSSRSTLKNQIFDKLRAIAESERLDVKYTMERKKVHTIDFSTDWFIRDRFERIIRRKFPSKIQVTRLNRYLARYKLSLHYNLIAIVLVDKHGRIISSTNEKLIGMDVSDQDMFKEGIKKGFGETYTGQPRYISSLNMNCISVSAPLISKDNSQVTGVIINVYNLEALNEVTTDRIGMEKTGEVYLVNRDKIMLTESRFTNDAPFRQVVDTEPVRKIIKDGKEMFDVYRDYRGESVVGISKDIPEYGWILLAEMDKSEAFIPLKILGITSLILGIVGTAVVVNFGMAFVISISRPVNDLTNATKELASGHLGCRVPVQRYDELGILANNFNTMAGELAKTITMHKQAEEELIRYSQELKRSNEELQHFAYVASHDLQEPLRMISSYLQLIERWYKGRLDTDVDEFITYAVDGASRLQTMINALLEYSRVDTRGKPFEPVDCEAILERALMNLEVAIRESQATITHTSLPTVMADSSQILQVFQNLISNAIKFHGSEPPRIHISVRREENEWVFSVHDNGIGIEPEYSKQLFNIFKRLHGREYPGVGLGLSICKKIINRHGGRIWLGSESGNGSVFYFTIPVQIKEKT
jgi:signal transduction histidine kinase